MVAFLSDCGIYYRAMGNMVSQVLLYGNMPWYTISNIIILTYLTLLKSRCISLSKYLLRWSFCFFYLSLQEMLLNHWLDFTQWYSRIKVKSTSWSAACFLTLYTLHAACLGFRALETHCYNFQHSEQPGYPHRNPCLWLFALTSTLDPFATVSSISLIFKIPTNVIHYPFWCVSDHILPILSYILCTF